MRLCGFADGSTPPLFLIPCVRPNAQINFHRFIVDEYSSLEAGTNSISEMCQHIKANHRWMVSGTPLTRDIQDLQEALSFLQVRGVRSGSLGYLARSCQFPRGACITRAGVRT